MATRSPGLLTTIQDRGRNGYQHLGVPVSGALDCVALAAANAQRNGLAARVRAAALDVAVMCSASILQGKLAHSVPLHIREILGNPMTDALAAIQFVRSTPGVTTALVGMSRAAHVEENMKLAETAPVAEDQFAELFIQK